MATVRIPKNRTMTFGAGFLMFVLLLGAATVHGQSNNCTLPDELRGVWRDSTKGWLTFSNDSISGYDIHVFGTFTLSCYLQNGTTYIMESNIFRFFSLDFNGYLCWTLYNVTDDLFYFYEHTNRLSSAGNERVRMLLLSGARDYNDICANPSPGLGTYRVLYRNGTLNNSISTCPSVLQRYFTFNVTIGGMGVCNGDISLDVCNSTSLLQVEDATNCSTLLGYSAEGQLGCLLYVQSGSLTYITVANNDVLVPIDYNNTYDITCLIIDSSSSPYTATQYPKQCPDDMNSTYVSYPGASVTLTVTGTCPVEETPTASISFPWMILIAALVGVLALLLLLSITCGCVCYRRRKRRLEEERKKLEEERRRAELEEGRNRLDDEDEDDDDKDDDNHDDDYDDDFENDDDHEHDGDSMVCDGDRGSTRAESPPEVIISIMPNTEDENDRNESRGRKGLGDLDDAPGFRSSGDVTPSSLRHKLGSAHKRFKKRRRVWMIGEDGKAIKVWKDDEDGKDPNDSGMEDEDENGNKTDGNGNKTDGNGNKTDGSGKKTDGKSNKTDGKSNKTDGKSNKTDGNGNKTDGNGNETDGNGNETDGNGNKIGGVYGGISKRNKDKDFFKQYGRKDVKESNELTDKGELKETNSKLMKKVKKMAVVKSFTQSVKRRSRAGSRRKEDGKPYKHSEKMGTVTDTERDSTDEEYDDDDNDDEEERDRRMKDKQGTSPDSGTSWDSGMSFYSYTSGTMRGGSSEGTNTEHGGRSREGGGPQDKSRQSRRSREDKSRESRRSKRDKSRQTKGSREDVSHQDKGSREDANRHGKESTDDVSHGGEGSREDVSHHGKGSREDVSRHSKRNREDGSREDVSRHSKRNREDGSREDVSRHSKRNREDGSREDVGRHSKRNREDGSREDVSRHSKRNREDGSREDVSRHSKRNREDVSHHGKGGRDDVSRHSKRNRDDVSHQGKGGREGVSLQAEWSKEDVSRQSRRDRRDKSGDRDRSTSASRDDGKGKQDGSEGRENTTGESDASRSGHDVSNRTEETGEGGKGEGESGKQAETGKGQEKPVGFFARLRALGRGRDKSVGDAKTQPASGKDKSGRDSEQQTGKDKSDGDAERQTALGKGHKSSDDTDRHTASGKGKDKASRDMEKLTSLLQETDKSGGDPRKQERSGKGKGKKETEDREAEGRSGTAREGDTRESKRSGKGVGDAGGRGAGGFGGGQGSSGPGGTSSGAIGVGGRGTDGSRGGDGSWGQTDRRRIEEYGLPDVEVDFLNGTEVDGDRTAGDGRMGHGRGGSHGVGRGRGGRGTAWADGEGTLPWHRGGDKPGSGGFRGDFDRYRQSTSTETTGSHTQGSSRTSTGTTVSFLPTSETSDRTRTSRRSGTSQLSSLASTRDDVTLPSSMYGGFISSDDGGTILRGSTSESRSSTRQPSERDDRSFTHIAGCDRGVTDATQFEALQVTPREEVSRDGRLRQSGKDQQDKGGHDASTGSQGSGKPLHKTESTITAIDLGDPFLSTGEHLEASRPPTQHQRRQGWQEDKDTRSRSRSPGSRDNRFKSVMDRSHSDRATTESRSVHWQADDLSVPGTTSEERRSVRWKPDSRVSGDTLTLPDTSRMSFRRYPDSDHTSISTSQPSRSSWVYSSMSQLVRIHRKKTAVAPIDDEDEYEYDDDGRIRIPVDEDDPTWKGRLEELYPDKKYLDYAKATSKNRPNEEKYLHGKAREGLRYLYGRAKFWSTQPPLVRPGTVLTIHSVDSSQTPSIHSRGGPSTSSYDKGL